MGTEAIWIPLALAAAGTGASVYNERRTAKKQDNELARGIREKSALQRKADSEVQKLISDTAGSNPQDEIAESLAQYTEQLRRSQGQQGSGIQGLSGASDKYQQDKVDATSGVAQYGSKIAGLMSRIDGASRQRENESINQANFQNRISMLGREGQGQDYLSRMRLDGIRPNAGLSALSEVLSGAAGGTYGTASTGGAKIVNAKGSNAKARKGGKR